METGRSGYQEYSDADLVDAYAIGDESALEELIDRHSGAVYHFASRLVGTAAAEDVTQEAFVKAWKQLHRFDRNARFRPWILAIARNTAIDRLRKRDAVAFSSLDAGDSAFEETVADDAPLPDAVLARADLEMQLERALDRLQPHYKTVVLLHDMEELTFEEIASVVGKPMNTVKSQYRRALQQLREMIGADAPN